MRVLSLLRGARLGVRTYCNMPEKTAVIVLADGAEEMEATISIDVLRRGEVNVTVAGLLGTEPVKCSRGTVIVPEVALADVVSHAYDVVILPGGQPGTNSLASSERVGHLLKSQNDAKKLIACICAAPFALKTHGIPAGSVTAHPSVKDKLIEGGYKWSDDSVVVSDNIVTSQGPGTTFEFALKLVEILNGKEKAESLKKPMCLKL